MSEMKSTKCENVMKGFLSLDKGEKIPLASTLHLLKCKKCRTEVRNLTLAEKEAARPLKVRAAMKNPQLSSIMSKINPNWVPEKEKNAVSLGGWIGVGVAMILLMMFFGIYSASMRSQMLSVAFYLVFAGCVISYGALFIINNMDFFVKKICRTTKFAA